MLAPNGSVMRMVKVNDRNMFLNKDFFSSQWFLHIEPEIKLWTLIASHMVWDDECLPQTEEFQNNYCSPLKIYSVFYIYLISVVRLVLFLKIL
jgi:hypothetical protein